MIPFFAAIMIHLAARPASYDKGDLSPLDQYMTVPAGSQETGLPPGGMVPCPGRPWTSWRGGTLAFDHEKPKIEVFTGFFPAEETE
jgi:hypothetical protein